MKNRKIISFVLVAVMLTSIISIFCIGASADDAWDGKTADMSWFLKDQAATTFEINNAEELYGLSVFVASVVPAKTVLGDGLIYLDANNKVIFDASKVGEAASSIASTAHYWTGYTVKLMADIDLGGHEFLPIGNSYGFVANFDGNGKTVKNFSIEDAGAMHSTDVKTRYYGFFAYLCGEVKDLNLKNVTINVTINPEHDVETVLCGGIAATNWSNNAGSVIKNCNVNGLTVNYAPNGNQTLKWVWIGAALGRVEHGGENTGVVVTNFKINNKASDTDLPLTIVDSMLYGGYWSWLGYEVKFTNSSVTLKQDAPEQPDQPGDTPSTGDMTWVVAVVAAAAVMGSAVVLKKREN